MSTRARKATSRAETEAQFQATVIELATLRDWTVYHDYDSRRSRPGFPDLCMVRDGRVLFAELKTEHGAVRVEQRAWLAMLGLCEGVETYLWRPSSWPQIERTLM